MRASGNEIIEQVLSVLEMKAPTFSSSIGVEDKRYPEEEDQKDFRGGRKRYREEVSSV